MTEEWQWKIGEYIAQDGGSPVEITYSGIVFDPFGRCVRQLVAGGLQGRQSEFETAGWRRVDPPKTEGAT